MNPVGRKTEKRNDNLFSVIRLPAATIWKWPSQQCSTVLHNKRTRVLSLVNCDRRFVASSCNKDMQANASLLSTPPYPRTPHAQKGQLPRDGKSVTERQVCNAPGSTKTQKEVQSMKYVFEELEISSATAFLPGQACAFFTKSARCDFRQKHQYGNDSWHRYGDYVSRMTDDIQVHDLAGFSNKIVKATYQFFCPCDARWKLSSVRMSIVAHRLPRPITETPIALTRTTTTTATTTTTTKRTAAMKKHREQDNWGRRAPYYDSLFQRPSTRTARSKVSTRFQHSFFRVRMTHRTLRVESRFESFTSAVFGVGIAR